MRLWILAAGLTLAGVSAFLLGRRAHGAAAPFDAPPALDPLRTPVLVELFTSEGCSSCPPADAELARLAHAAPFPTLQVVPLAFHVDYWNELGWPDPFSSPEMTQRQRSYAQSLRMNHLYTPQAVVDGASEFSGADDSAARQAVEAAARSPKARVTMEIDRTGAAKAAVPVVVHVAPLVGARAADTAELVVALTQSGVRIDVRRGENAGHALEHSAVVRYLHVAGTVPASGATMNASVPLLDAGPREELRIVAFVQERSSRRVLGVGSLAP
jgi:hypothetical protein